MPGSAKTLARKGLSVRLDEYFPDLGEALSPKTAAALAKSLALPSQDQSYLAPPVENPARPTQAPKPGSSIDSSIFDAAFVVVRGQSEAKSRRSGHNRAEFEPDRTGRLAPSVPTRV